MSGVIGPGVWTLHLVTVSETTQSIACRAGRVGGVGCQAPGFMETGLVTWHARVSSVLAVSGLAPSC